jgi:purine-binding chemotaxis protein CheW
MAQRAADMLGRPMATVENYLHGFTTRRGRSDDWQLELLAFDLGQETYALDILRLRGIVTRRPATEVPRAPAYLLGVVSLRGQIIPLVDLRLRLGLPATAPTRATRILVVDQAGEAFGLLVDSVRQVVRLRDDELETRPPALAGRESEFIAGIARPRQGGMLILLGVDAVLKLNLGARPVERGVR